VGIYTLVSPLFYHTELAIEKINTALIEVTWELWKLAKFARDKGQYFSDPQNSTMFLVEKNIIKAGKFREEVIDIYAVRIMYVET
jgi:hypothetical protein